MTGTMHIRVDYLEAVFLKKEILLLEKGLLEIIKHSREYNALRKKEFVLKSKVKKELESTEKLLLSIDSDLPQDELLEMNLIQKKTSKPIMKELKQSKIRLVNEKQIKRNNIESQIQDIQEKLARLS